MELQRKIIQRDVMVLLRLKTLNDFHGEGFETVSFCEKFYAFESVEEETGIVAKEYNESVEYWIKKNILKRDKTTFELSVTDKGKIVFEEMEHIKYNDQETIGGILKAHSPFMEAVNKLKSNTHTIVEIINCVSKVTEIAINVLDL